MNPLEEDQVTLIQEMLGYFLLPVNHAQKCFIIVEKGGAGKSVLLRVLRTAAGKRKCVQCSMAGTQ